jgi:hypothetical protein
MRPDGKRIDPLHHLDRQPATGALVDRGRIEKPVAQDPLPLGQRGHDDLAH